MVKKYLLLVLLVSFQMFSQEAYLSFGKNYTKFDYFSNSTDLKFQSGIGNHYEVGYKTKLWKNKLDYSVSLQLDDYNAVGNTAFNSYLWQTNFVGLNGGLHFNALKLANLSIQPSVNLNLSTMIYGKQSIDGVLYDLKNESDFKGLWIQPSYGLMAFYKTKNLGKLFFGYQYRHSLRSEKSTGEKLNFITQQLSFGIQFSV